MRLIITLLFGMTLSACAMYQPIPEGYQGPKATISDSYSNFGKWSAHYFVLNKVNDQYIEDSYTRTRAAYYGQGTRFTPIVEVRKVMAKEQKLMLSGYIFYPTDGQQLILKSLSVDKVFLFTPKADEVYTVKGELNDSVSKVWLEDSSGEIVEKSLGMVNH